MKEHKEYAQMPEASDETLVESPREEEEEPGLAVGDLGHLAFEPLDEQLYSAAVWEEFFYELRPQAPAKALVATTTTAIVAGPAPALQQAFDI